MTKTITKESVRDLIVIIPPIELQEKFCRIIGALENKKSLINQSINETQQLFDYTMDKYFNEA